MATRSLEELNRTTRGLCYAEEYSLTEGWDDNKVGAIFNLGLNKLYQAITENDQPANIEQVKIASIAGVQAYDLPIDVYMAIRINDARFYWGTSEYNFVTLEQRTISERLGYPTQFPTSFAIRNGQILLTPAPGVTKDDAIVLNFQKRLRTIDFRRGQVNTIKGAVIDADQAATNVINVDAGHTIATDDIVQFLDSSGTVDVQRTASGTAATTITVSGDPVTVVDDGTIRVVNPITLTLNFPSNSSKWSTMQANAEELDKVEFICIVDRDGEPIVSQIPIDSYDTSTHVITVGDNYTMPLAEMTALDSNLNDGNKLYIVCGRYASTHSELDMTTENYLIEYGVLRLLRLQSNVAQSKEQSETEERTLQSMIVAYKRYRKSVYPIRWIDKYKSRGGRGGLGRR